MRLVDFKNKLLSENIIFSTESSEECIKLQKILIEKYGFLWTTNSGTYTWKYISTHYDTKTLYFYTPKFDKIKNKTVLSAKFVIDLHDRIGKIKEILK